jgi:hypothetical protein
MTWCSNKTKCLHIFTGNVLNCMIPEKFNFAEVDLLVSHIVCLTSFPLIWAMLTLMMEAAQTFETLVNSYQSTWRYNPEDSHLLLIFCYTLSIYFYSFGFFFFANVSNSHIAYLINLHCLCAEIQVSRYICLKLKFCVCVCLLIAHEWLYRLEPNFTCLFSVIRKR